MIQRYSHFLFDADETLFRFDAYAGLKLMFSQYGVDFTRSDFETYQTVNQPLWIRYQNGDISADALQTTRFNEWASTLGVSANELNDRFLDSMATICKPLDGTHELIKYLMSHRKSLTIVTNGFTALQERRLKQTGLWTAFDHVIVSEEVGHAKPSHHFFDHTFEKLGLDHKDKPQILMIGDTLSSDILGGINAGIDTCWVNHHHATSGDIRPTYNVSDLHQLLALLQAGS